MKKPHERVCIGARGRFYTCPHKSFTFASVFNLTPSIGTLNADYHFRELCAQDKCNSFLFEDNTHRFYTCRYLDMEVPTSTHKIRLYWRGRARVWEVDHRYSAQLHDPESVPGLVNASHDFIANALRTLHACICPHLSTSDAIVIDEIKAQASSMFDCYSKEPRMQDLGSKSDTWPTRMVLTTCHNRYCGAMCATEWEEYGHGLLVVVIRPFDYSTATDKNWIAKLESGGADCG
jgi:hypothetical protein